MYTPAVFWLLVILHASLHICANSLEHTICRTVVYHNDFKLMVWQRLATKARQRGKHEITTIVGTEDNTQARTASRTLLALDHLSISICFLLSSHKLSRSYPGQVKIYK